jgi:hypothetical protein
MTAYGTITSVRLNGHEIAFSNGNTIKAFNRVADAANMAAGAMRGFSSRSWKFDVPITIDERGYTNFMWSVYSRTTPPLKKNATEKEFRKWRRKFYRQMKDDHERWKQTEPRWTGGGYLVPVKK